MPGFKLGTRSKHRLPQFTLGTRSRHRLRGVHADLVRVVERAIELTEVDFTVLEGMRSVARQKELVKAGASQTMNSRHLTGHAVDLGALVNGAVRWDWPLYHRIADAMKRAASELGVSLEWGGDWKSFKDGPHFQLPRKLYP
jgi:peptidoglycan L-alanyl-D-glutamate endopeptidase CwlK